jgi:alpha-amylase/alpha-mannosidase (GH57 family)
MTAKRYLCIHGHFYQPPRENPWLESIEVQDSAYPYHDWNERINAECYAPNAASRILDEQGRIEQIVNNYARISFNVGPTLLAWMEGQAPATYAAILQADRESRMRFGGHGSALAQAYNHTILPLTNARDKATQIAWGYRDFEQRFGRVPEGMWLAETAVDLASLELLAERGIKFTLLAPHQAARVRKLDDPAWTDVTGGRIDPTQPYLCRLASGKTLTLFFYDGPISQAVAFEGLLNKGEHFAGRLLGGFSDRRPWPQLLHIATDGETYGHHHRYGEMALSYAVQVIDARDDVELTNYGAYLAAHPPTHEVEIYENTAWSCAHGVERWREHCGCASGRNPGWNQRWRKPLRAALDWLRDETAPRFAAAAGALLKDPWAARDDYIDVLLNRAEAGVQRFFERHALRPLSEAEQIKALKLLELERHALLMYTSCGWFFDDVAGIETVQVIQYAARVIQLASMLFEKNLEPAFEELLDAAQSNDPRHGTGKTIYQRRAKPASTDLAKVGAHYAMSSLFEDYGERTRVYCYEVERQEYRAEAVGRARVAIGHARIRSVITHAADIVSFGVLHFGDHNLLGGVRSYRGDESYRDMQAGVLGAFTRADFPETIRQLDRHFGPLTYTLKTLFHDEQRRILGTILQATFDEAEAAYRQIYDYHLPLMRFMTDLGMPMPKTLRTAGEFIVNSDLRRQFERDEPELAEVRRLLDEARLWSLEFDAPGLAYTLQTTLERLARRLNEAPTPANLAALSRVGALLPLLPFEVNLWEAQNAYVRLLRQSQAAAAPAEGASVRRLGELLHVKAA